MGQKVNPVGFRLGIIPGGYNTIFYANRRDYPNRVCRTIDARRLIRQELAEAAISKIFIQHLAKVAHITIHSARPGNIIGRKGEEIEKLREKIKKILGVAVHINVQEIARPELESSLVAENVAQQLEKRVMFRKAMKRAVQNALRAGAKGIKIQVSGRLGGAEIARTEWYKEGRIPLHTLRANIDYSSARAQTTYGVIGIKVWINKGNVMVEKGAAEKVSLKKLDSTSEQPAKFKRTPKGSSVKDSTVISSKKKFGKTLLNKEKQLEEKPSVDSSGEK